MREWENGKRTTIKVEDGKVYTHTQADIEPELKAAAAARAEHSIFRKSKEGMGDVAAIFPAIIVDKWLVEYGFNWFRASRAEREKWLAGPHAKPFLTKPRKR